MKIRTKTLRLIQVIAALSVLLLIPTTGIQQTKEHGIELKPSVNVACLCLIGVGVSSVCGYLIKKRRTRPGRPKTKRVGS